MYRNEDELSIHSRIKGFISDDWFQSIISKDQSVNDCIKSFSFINRYILNILTIM